MHVEARAGDGLLPIEVWENEGGSAPRAGEPADSLEWAAFSTRRFPERRRHDLEAIVAYAQYARRRMREPRRALRPNTIEAVRPL